MRAISSIFHRMQEEVLEEVDSLATEQHDTRGRLHPAAVAYIEDDWLSGKHASGWPPTAAWPAAATAAPAGTRPFKRQ